MSAMGRMFLEMQTQQENAEYVHSRATSNIGHRDQPSMGHYLVRNGAIPQRGDDYVQHSSGAAPSTERRGVLNGIVMSLIALFSLGCWSLLLMAVMHLKPVPSEQDNHSRKSSTRKTSTEEMYPWSESE